MSYPVMDNVTGVTGVLEYANSVSKNWYMPSICVAIIFIVFAALLRLNYRKSDCVMVSGIVGFMMSGLFWAGGLVSGKIVVIIMVYMIVGIVYSFIER